MARVLIVDDEAGYLRLARRLLQPRFEVVGEALGGEAAVRAARRLRPDVVLLDVNLPDANGFDLAARLAGGPDAPAVVLMSTEDLTGAAVDVERSGARGFVLKAELDAESLAGVLAGRLPPRLGRPRVVLAEDQVLLREGLARLLDDAGFDVVDRVGDAAALLRSVEARRPDVVITDVQMPPDRTDDGLRAAIEIRRRRPETGVVVLSQFLEERYALELVGERADGAGYLLKDRVGDIDAFADAVRRVARGGSALDPEVVALMVGRSRVDDPLGALTARERDVLALVAEGRSNQGIAGALSVTPAAVERHLTSIFAKLGLGHAPADNRRVLAVLAFLRA
ncbi:response regulator [Miltoncostaea marina]|uniref:response regulator n=1 Tax=Miltoncostaea marina TaxID=2843215 RepID=UPI001C3E84AF|nr:response regulator [Miltoncostaea marina]